MLHFVDFKDARLARTTLAPSYLRPLFDAARNGQDLHPVVAAIVRELGFDSFTCAFSTTPRPDRNAQLYVFTTLSREWTRRYDEAAYVEIDPRIQLVNDRSTILIWNGLDFYGRSERLDQFLQDAARHGLRSSASFTLHDVNHNGVMISYNSTRTRLNPETIASNLGTLYAFGTHFHDEFMRLIVKRGLPSRLQGATLTRREIEVLRMVARGHTSQDIGIKLEITPRTVKFHMDSARTKMCAANRQEAVALAVKAGLFDVLP
jgi:DNA-binding CsgD family transcriptional regulator